MSNFSHTVYKTFKTHAGHSLNPHTITTKITQIHGEFFICCCFYCADIQTAFWVPTKDCCCRGPLAVLLGQSQGHQGQVLVNGKMDLRGEHIVGAEHSQHHQNAVDQDLERERRDEE